MLVLTFLLFLQSSVDRAILEAEDARVADPRVLLDGLTAADARTRALAVRALGRLERPVLGTHVERLLRAPEIAVRTEAVQAMGQMGAVFDWAALLTTEKDPGVRGVIYQTIGRMRSPTPAVERALERGLSETDSVTVTGAAKGLESLFRQNASTWKPFPQTVESLRRLVRGLRVQGTGSKTPAITAQLALLALTAIGDSDAETLAIAIEDANAQVRRLAVIASKQWREDSSPMVRYDALRVAGNCERATRAIADSSEHVLLLAIDKLGEGCASSGILEKFVDTDRNWRRRAHAIVALAKVDPESARRRLPTMVRRPDWQERAWAARAAQTLKDAPSLEALLKDSHPNVIAAALSRPEDAVRFLDHTHHGLVMDAAQLLKGWPQLATAVPSILAALEKLSARGAATSHDPRRQLLDRLGETGDRTIAGRISYLLSDFDPRIATRAAEVISALSGSRVEPRNTRYQTAPVPATSTIAGLRGATARVRMKGLGAFTIELLPDDAPVTVASFADLAAKKYYNGLTFHRVVPNFVIQGGSPGANEYDGIAPYTRDEIGLRAHTRGTLGISTRGRDTGDMQIFVNLVNNFRLDHGYTVFGEVIEGMDVVDRIQEGDVIESIEVRGRPNR